MYREITSTVGLLLILLAGCVTVTPTSTPTAVPAAEVSSTAER